ncbi:chromosome segregation protein SMC [Nocardioides sp. WL0053]|uniref:Chromosome segregation protein SMC n=1 Tax=Nocardioides jiangsuensis TaxID=2866161 RepID=A0ABS7RI26_9ACTN|nr:SAV_6107 family HEPN domain-containing protein [Nocardioides jiangsuensis]MBY9073718.1 chromosome segregation protein SMC [Nocardioides jiangsuensis]
MTTSTRSPRPHGPAGPARGGAVPPGPARHPLALPAATHSYLERAAASLREAITTSEVTLRYAHAHVSALRATAALLAARAHPVAGARRGRSPQKNAWVLLAEVAPELSEWAAFFAAGAAKRAAAEAGSVRAVTEREADDLVRDADRFLGVVEECLGLTRHVPFQEYLPLVQGRSGVA